jgi:hypothetical protein
MSGRRNLFAVWMVAVTVLVLLIPLVAASEARTGVGAPVAIDVLSNRADLVSGGEALVAVVVPAATKSTDVRVQLAGRDHHN